MDQILVTLKTTTIPPFSLAALPHTHLPCLNWKIKSLFHSAGRSQPIAHENNSVSEQINPFSDAAEGRGKRAGGSPRHHGGGRRVCPCFGAVVGRAGSAGQAGMRQTAKSMRSRAISHGQQRGDGGMPWHRHLPAQVWGCSDRTGRRRNRSFTCVSFSVSSLKKKKKLNFTIL